MPNESLMSYIVELVETNEGDSALILSTLDHLLTGYSWEKRMEFFACPVDSITFNKLSLINRSWLSGLAEYVFNHNRKNPPTWALDPINKLRSVEENPIYNVFEEVNPEKAKQISLELLNESLPEMRKRNIIAESVFDSI